MPNQTFDPPNRTVANIHPSDPQADAARRQALLEASTLRWLRDADRDRADARALTARTLRDWLRDTPSEHRVERLGELSVALHRQLAPRSTPDAAAFISAFAHTMMETAVAEVEREAACAGHVAWFTALRPFLHVEPTEVQRADLTTRLDGGEAALALALTRLRRRLHERIDAALRLWAPDREARDLLRRRLRDSLIATEPTP
ncbi:MAG: hypothetical protein JSS44_05170 [Proteobacteria bacterium]|nr:hypothetical protein [Pseudomonadota bacterium]MBS0464040.1 hypothetical protein [Pseudomonadota bacterium]